MNTPQQTFSKKVDSALTNDVRRNNYRKALDGFAVKRKNAYAKLPEQGETMRDRAHTIRLNSILSNRKLLRQLEKNLVANGIRVYHAATAIDANEQVEKILHTHNAKKVVKGKSMITEEIHLNAHLEAAGIEVVETDLGEYIVQLDKDIPAHIVAPIIHKNRSEIAETMSSALDKKSLKTAQAEKLTLAARDRLRKDFYTADAGISGVNFAVAETGTLCLVENEGNGRLTTTIPPIHIALMSLEKVVDRLKNIPLLYELLTRSASGQAITTYFNMISSPRRADELDGPKEVHLIILDNGRSKLLADPLLKKTLLCIRCGACLNSCPIYLNIGGHAYDAVIPGPIGKILMPQIYGLQRYGHLPGSSSLCGSCVDVCPVKIPITDILLQLRSDYNGYRSGDTLDRLGTPNHTPSSQNNTSHVDTPRSASFQETWQYRLEKTLFFGWSLTFAHPRLYKWSGRFAILTRKNVLPFMIKIFPLLRHWTQTRAFPTPAPKTFLTLIHEERQASKNKKPDSPH